MVEIKVDNCLIQEQLIGKYSQWRWYPGTLSKNYILLNYLVSYLLQFVFHEFRSIFKSSSVSPWWIQICISMELEKPNSSVNLSVSLHLDCQTTPNLLNHTYLVCKCLLHFSILNTAVIQLSAHLVSQNLKITQNNTVCKCL